MVSDTRSTSDHSTRQNHTRAYFTHMSREGNTDLINHKFFDLQCVCSCRVKEKHMLHHERMASRVRKCVKEKKKLFFTHTFCHTKLITNERDSDYKLQKRQLMNHEI